MVGSLRPNIPSWHQATTLLIQTTLTQIFISETWSSNPPDPPFLKLRYRTSSLYKTYTFNIINQCLQSQNSQILPELLTGAGSPVLLQVWSGIELHASFAANSDLQETYTGHFQSITQTCQRKHYIQKSKNVLIQNLIKALSKLLKTAMVPYIIPFHLVNIFHWSMN